MLESIKPKLNSSEITWESTSNPNCFNVLFGEFEFMICKSFTGKGNETELVIKFFDSVGFFNGDESYRIKETNTIYSKCMEVFKSGKKYFNPELID